MKNRHLSCANMKKKRHRILMPLLIGGCISAGAACIYMAIGEEQPYKQAKVSYDTLRSAVILPSEGDDHQEKNETLNRQIDFELLKEKNEDIVAWLYIPGTQVDYPVCRGTDNTYYLHHNAEKEKNILGSLFVDSGNEPDLRDPHLVIYGHNMRQGQMFGELSNYEEVDFLQQQPYVYLYTPDEENVYQIYSVYRCEPSDDTYTTGFMFRTKSYMDWLNETLTKETYETGAEQMVNAGQQVLTLSTCADGDRKDRLVVNCVEVDKDDGQKRTEREY